MILFTSIHFGCRGTFLIKKLFSKHKCNTYFLTKAQAIQTVTKKPSAPWLSFVAILSHFHLQPLAFG
ncbi:hypothetical protein EBZ39_10115 [bacterium]|nr:hypothetical protein [bacterium]